MLSRTPGCATSSPSRIARRWSGCARGIHAVTGDASDPEVLAQTHVMRARTLVIATPDAFRTRKMVETARILNPKIETVVRTHSDEETDLLRRESVGRIFFGEEELANGMIRHVLEAREPAAS